MEVDTEMTIESFDNKRIAYKGISVSKRFDNFALYDINLATAQIFHSGVDEHNTYTSECYYAKFHNVYKLRRYSVHNIYRTVIPHSPYKYLIFDISSNEVHMSNCIEISKNSYIHYKILCFCELRDIFNLSLATPIVDISEIYCIDNDYLSDDENLLEGEMNCLSI